MSPFFCRWVIPVQCRGNIGKSTAMSLLAQYCDHHGVPWRGFDLDPDHRSFHRAFPEQVAIREIADEPEAEIIQVARSPHDVPVILLDPRAHMADAILRAWSVIRFPEQLAALGGRITVLLFPGDDLELLTDIDTTVGRLGDTVDYLVVRNPARQPRTRMFTGSPLEADLLRLGAVFWEIPPLLALARNHLAALEAELGRGVSYTEAVANRDLPLDAMIRLIVEDWVRTAFRRCDAVADKILPTACATQVARVDAGNTEEAPRAKRGAKINKSNL